MTTSRSAARPHGLAVRWRSWTAGSRSLITRRIWRDRGIVLVALALTAVAAFLAAAAPREITTTLDRAAREALVGGVDEASLQAVVGVSGTSTNPQSSSIGVDPTDLGSLAAEMPARLVSPLLGRVGTPEVQVASGVLKVAGISDVGAEIDPRLGRDDHAEVAMLPDVGAAVRVVEGALPVQQSGIASGKDPAQIVLTRAVATAFDITVGQLLTISSPGDTSADLQVVGLVEPVDPEAPFWSSFPEALEPVVAKVTGRKDYARATVLTDAEGVAGISLRLRSPFQGTITMPLDVAAFDATTVPQVLDAVARIQNQPSLLMPDAATPPRLTALVGDGVAQFSGQARAGVAQMSVTLAGVIGVAAAVIALIARLLVQRRLTALLLERARGASLVAIGGRLLVESLLVTAIGCVAGVALASKLEGGWDGVGLPLIAVAAVSAGASPILGVTEVRAAWSGRREPANKQQRATLRKRRNLRRLVLEATAVVLAAAAVVSLRGRGVLQHQTAGVDPFLAAAPILLALAAVVVLIRLYPVLLRPFAALGRRGRGPLGVLATADGAAALAVLPLLALTLGTAIGVASALISSTVHDGQDQASWERIGADVRIDGTITDADVAAVRAEPGVEAAATVVQQNNVDLSLGTTWSKTSMLGIDADYATLVALTPLDPGGDLTHLAEPDQELPLPALTDPAYTGKMVEGRSAISAGGTSTPFTSVGLVVNPTAYRWMKAPYLVVDLETLLSRQDPAGYPTRSLLVVGPGSDAAAEAVFGGRDVSVTSRAEWLTLAKSNALMGGIDRFFVLGSVLAALLAVVALGASVLTGARERGRTLATLRTLGLSARYGWWLALAQLLPLVLAALLAGCAAAIAIVTQLGPALGLDVLAGSFGAPAITVSPTTFAYVGVGALLLVGVSVLVEVLAHRSDNLSNVLRLGETS